MRPITITQNNFQLLQQLLIEWNGRPGPDQGLLQDLDQELNRAQVVPAEAIPPDVVTLHARARILDLDTGEKMLFQLVLPEEANADAGRLSVLAPLGTAILGYRTGDTLSWKVPGGTRHLKVIEVLDQPEAQVQSAIAAQASSPD